MESAKRDKVPSGGGFSRNYFLLVLFAAISLAALWRWTPLHRWVNLTTLAAWGAWLQEYRWTPILIPAIYAAAGLLVISHALMIWATVLIFPPFAAFWYAEIGTLASGCVVYGVGRYLRR